MNTQANPADQDGTVSEHGINSKTPVDNNDGKVDKTPAASGQDDKKTPSGDDPVSGNGTGLKTQEQMIPMSRFREVIEEKNKYKDELDKRTKAEEKQRQKEMEEQGKYQELIAEKDKELELANKSKEELAQHQEALQEILVQELEKIPERQKALIPEELPIVAKLKYIAKNRAFLMGEKSSTGAPIPPNSKNLSDFEAKKQRYDELMTRQAKGEFLTESERREIMKLGQEIVAQRAKL